MHKLVGDLSRASNVHPASFRITNISAGSLLVDTDLEIRADPAGRCPPPADIAAELERQAADPRSLLRRGSLTCQIESITRTDAGVDGGEAHEGASEPGTSLNGAAKGGHAPGRTQAQPATTRASGGAPGGRSSRQELQERHKHLDRCEGLLASAKQALKDENVSMAREHASQAAEALRDAGEGGEFTGDMSDMRALAKRIQHAEVSAEVRQGDSPLAGLEAARH